MTVYMMYGISQIIIIFQLVNTSCMCGPWVNSYQKFLQDIIVVFTWGERVMFPKWGKIVSSQIMVLQIRACLEKLLAFKYH